MAASAAAAANNTTQQLSSLDDYYDSASKVMFEFVLHGVFLNLIGCVGLVGNAICICILSRPQMKGSTNLILCALATFDAVLIVTSMLMLSLPAIYRYTQSPALTWYYESVFPYVTPSVYALGMVAQTGSVYSTLCVTIERYIVICWPLRAQDFITYGRTKISILLIIVFAFLYNISRFFEITWQVKDPDKPPTIVTTPMRENQMYISIYITWMYLVFMYTLPFTGLSVMNLLMFLDVRRSNSRNVTLSHSQKKEMKLAIMLMIVVLVFLACNVLPFIVNIMELFSISYKPLTEVSNLLVTLNSSCNIFIYTIFGEKFQRQLCLSLRRACSCLTGKQDNDDDRYFSKSLYYSTAPRKQSTTIMLNRLETNNGGGDGSGAGGSPATDANGANGGNSKHSPSNGEMQHLLEADERSPSKVIQLDEMTATAVDL